jgi:Domain of unknown function (DUF5134)
MNSTETTKTTTMSGSGSSSSASHSSMGASSTMGPGGGQSMHAAAASSHSSNMAMNGMSMSSSHATVKMSMGGMSMSAPHGATNILPDWLAVIWTLVFLVILVVHVRHVLQTHGERRFWHSGHVLMALGMVFMYAPGSLDHFNIPNGFWPLLFANAAGAVVAWILARTLYGRPVNGLWAVLAFGLAAMAYMWSPSGYVAPLTWLLVAYFAAEALLWATNSYRKLDEHLTIRGIGVNPDGTLSATAVEPLVCERDLRVSMAAMALGMAYMFAATQLLL